MNKKGSSLVIAMTIMTVGVLIILPLIGQTVNERHMSGRASETIRAFYASESGLNDAIWSLNNYGTSKDWTDMGWNISNTALYTLTLQPLVDSQGITVGSYSVELNNPTAANPSVEATGYTTNTPTTTDAKKSMRVFLERSTAAVTAKGGINIQGNATINGDIMEYADFTFNAMFDRSAEAVRGDAEDTEIIDTPVNSYDPVPRPEDTYTDLDLDGEWDTGEPLIDDWNNDLEWDDEVDITWFEWDGNNDYLNPPKAEITASSWTGTEVLVVYGGDLKITGGTFEGVVYVKSKEITVVIDGEPQVKHVGGNLGIAGNAEITGAIFVDGSVDGVTGISGTPTITYDPTKVTLDGFNGQSPMPFVRQNLTWVEIQK
jgi:Tfp pilus assembly protein PilX